MSDHEPVAESPASSSADAAHANQVCDMLHDWLSDQKTVKVFVQLLERHVDEPTVEQTFVLTKACASLCTLTTLKANISTFGESGGVHILHELIKVYLDVPGDLLAHACSIMCNVTANSEKNRARCVADGCVETMVRLLYEHHKGWACPLETVCKTILEEACATLIHITESFAGWCKCNVAGVVDVLVVLLTRHVVDGPSMLVTRACQALRNVAKHATNRTASGAVRGVEVVVDLIRHYRDGPVELTKHACGALSNLMSFFNGHNDTHVACSKAGGVEALINVLTHHDAEKCADLFELVCGALRNAMLIPDNKVKCAVVDGVQALVRIIKSYQKLPGNLIQAACAALLESMLNMTQNQQTCGQVGGVQTLVSVIQHYSSIKGPSTLLRFACGALHQAVATVDANKTQCIQAEAVPTLVDLIRRVMTNPQHETPQQRSDFFEQACAALQSIIEFSSAQGIASEVKVLVDLVRIWNSEVPRIVLRLVCATIRTIVAGNCSDDQTKFVACGGVDAFVGLVNRHGNLLALSSNYQIAQDVCKVLIVVATNNVDSKLHFHAVGGFETMIRFLRVTWYAPLIDDIKTVLAAMCGPPNQQNDGELSNTELRDSVVTSTSTATTKPASTHTTTTTTTATTSPSVSVTSVPASDASSADQHQTQQTECIALLKQMEEAAFANQALQTSLHSALLKQMESATINSQLQHALQAQIQQLLAQITSQSNVIEELKSTSASQADQVNDAKAAHAVATQQTQAAEAKLAATFDALKSLLLNANKAAPV